jgi:outer membrane receptor for ferrienterochelin and colicins
MKIRIILLIIIAANLFAGKHYVYDAETKKPLVAASVFIKSKDTDFKKMVFTDSDGIFNIDYSGVAFVNITFMGYESFSDTINLADYPIFNLKFTDIYIGEIVTTGQYAPKSIQKSVYNISVISDEKIKSRASNNLYEVMTTENNVSLSQDGILGSSMSINGISGQNIKIMIDGVPVIGRLNGNVDLSQINMNNVKQIEIIEGPMSAIYGTDALGGVVNIITNDKIDNDLHFTMNSLYESVGKYNFDGNLAYSYRRHKFITNGGRYFFSGFNDPDTSRYKQWKPKEQYFGDFQYILDGEDFKLKYKLDYFQDLILNRGRPRLPYGESAFDDKYYTYRFNNSLFFNGTFGNAKFYDLTLNYSDYTRIKNTFIKNLVTLDEQMTSDPADQDTSVFNSIIARATFSDDRTTSKIKYQTGLDIQIDNAEGKKIKNENMQIANYAWFGSMQYDFSDDLKIQPALRLIYNTEYEAPIIPSLNIKYDITNYLTARASYAKGFRAPSLKELYFLFVDINHNIQGAEDLQAETSNSFNLSLNFHKENQQHAFKFEPSIFYNDIQDLISLANVDSDLYSYVNIGEYKTGGLNLDLSYYRPDISSKFGYSLLAKSYSLSEDVQSNDFVFTNEFNGTIIYSIPKIETKFTISYKYTGKKEGFVITEDEEISEYNIEDYNMLDLTLSKTFLNDNLTFAFGVKNLLDVKDLDRIGAASGQAHTGGSYSVPVGFGRTLFAKLNFTIN